ncbi:MAG: hypothetical protein ACRESZ_04540, partial [Methylococcales bacterium]
YNHPIPQRAIDHRTPMQSIQKWRKDKPDLFVEKEYNQAELDIYGCSPLDTDQTRPPAAKPLSARHSAGSHW